MRACVFSLFLVSRVLGLNVGLTPVGRRDALGAAALGGASVLAPSAVRAETALPPAAPTVELKSGLSYQDFKVGSGSQPAQGQRVTIDYVMQTSGARYGSKIYSTRDAEVPFSFVLGDPNVIAGLNEAVGTMKAGGVRRVFVPAALRYTSVGKEAQQPIPPPDPTFGEYQRWKNIYANPNRPYQPDLILDVKLFGRK